MIPLMDRSPKNNNSRMNNSPNHNHHHDKNRNTTPTHQQHQKVLSGSPSTSVKSLSPNQHHFNRWKYQTKASSSSSSSFVSLRFYGCILTLVTIFILSILSGIILPIQYSMQQSSKMYVTINQMIENSSNNLHLSSSSLSNRSSSSSSSTNNSTILTTNRTTTTTTTPILKNHDNEYDNTTTTATLSPITIPPTIFTISNKMKNEYDDNDTTRTTTTNNSSSNSLNEFDTTTTRTTTPSPIPTIITQNQKQSKSNLNSNSNDNRHHHHHPKFAMIYFMDDCDPEDIAKTNRYRQYIQNILVNVAILKATNSTTDTIVYIKMSTSSSSFSSNSYSSTSVSNPTSHNDSNTTTTTPYPYNYSYHDGLPAKDIALFERMNIQYRYIPNSHHHHHYKYHDPNNSTNNSNNNHYYHNHHPIHPYDLFRVYQLIQYDRVLIMNQFTTLKKSMDSFFHFSMTAMNMNTNETTTSNNSMMNFENMILRNSDSTTKTNIISSSSSLSFLQKHSLILLQPNEQTYKELLHFIQQKEMEYYHFNTIQQQQQQQNKQNQQQQPSYNMNDVFPLCEYPTNLTTKDFDDNLRTTTTTPLEHVFLYYWIKVKNQSVTILDETNNMYQYKNGLYNATGSNSIEIRKQNISNLFFLLNYNLDDDNNNNNIEDSCQEKENNNKNHSSSWKCYPPYRDMIQYTHLENVPWLQQQQQHQQQHFTNNNHNTNMNNNDNSNNTSSDIQFWFTTLQSMQDTYNITIELVDLPSCRYTNNMNNGTTQQCDDDDDDDNDDINNQQQLLHPSNISFDISDDTSYPFYSFTNRNDIESISEPYQRLMNNNNNTNTTTTNGKFAYAFVVGGCDPDDPTYRHYFYDILISTYLLRNESSTADIIVFVQLLQNSIYDTLPISDVQMLHAMDIQIHYIPKSSEESFYRTMLDKFRILELTQYDRVSFLDSDVMVLGNMDYLFHLSMNGTLKPNVVFAGKVEPANGGHFMLQPKEGLFQDILQIIHEKEMRGKLLPYPHWNETIGWGHEINPKNNDDYYSLVNGKKQYLWNFHGAFADQGLLYHWVKYVQKNVSIIFKNKVENWDTDENNTIVLENWFGMDVIDQYSNERECFTNFLNGAPCMGPHQDYIHFTGRAKPWLHKPPADYLENPKGSAGHYWFYVLHLLNNQYQYQLEFDNWITGQRPLLGLYPKYGHAATTTYRPHHRS